MARLVNAVVGAVSALEELYWRWVDGPLMECPLCRQRYRKNSPRGRCIHVPFRSGK